MEPPLAGGSLRYVVDTNIFGDPVTVEGRSVPLSYHCVSGIPRERSSVALVEAMLRLASALQLTTVAEGVETEEQLYALRAFRCDRWLGFLHGRPMPAQQIRSRLPRLP